MLPAPRMTTFPPVPVTCDAVRNKCREMLTAALQTDCECPLDSLVSSPLLPPGAGQLREWVEPVGC